MARKKATTVVDDFDFKSLAKETGGVVLSDQEVVKYFIDTGNLALNYCNSGRYITGGVPGGKLIEVYGPSSSSKSLLATNILRGCQKLNGISAILDCENASDAEFMQKAGHLDCSKVVRYAPETLERCFSAICKLTNKVREKKGNDYPLVVVFDSITVPPCEREFTETFPEGKCPPGYNPTEWKKLARKKEQPGERAKACNKGLRQINSIIEKQNITVFVINQIRSKIGVLYGNPETTGGGGNALPFYASCRMRTQAQKKILNAKHKTVVGVNLKVKNVKNRAFKPFFEVENIKLYFDAGIDPLSGLLSTLLKSERIIAGDKANTYLVKPEYLEDGMDEYKFKAKLSEDFIDRQVVLDCPKLIDATSREQVELYLKDFEDAMSGSNNSDFIETNVSSDDLDELVDEVDEDELEDSEENADSE